MDSARRYNEGKPRYSLLDKDFLEEFTKVMTYGYNKYTTKDEQGNIISTGRDNWRLGLSWSDTIDSMMRHLAEFRDRKLYDDESGLHHMAHIACNAMFLHYYSKHKREFDDMPKNHFHNKRIGLDIDEVLADFLGAFKSKYPAFNRDIHSWHFDREIQYKFEDMKLNGDLNDFYLNLKPLVKAEDLPFEPVCYITNRPVISEISTTWLDYHGFPHVPVITTKDKAKACVEYNLAIFVDDNFFNFKEINNNTNTVCYLYDQLHNRKFDVGYLRIKNLKEIL